MGVKLVASEMNKWTETRTMTYIMNIVRVGITRAHKTFLTKFLKEGKCLSQKLHINILLKTLWKYKVFFLDRIAKSVEKSLNFRCRPTGELSKRRHENLSGLKPLIMYAF